MKSVPTSRWSCRVVRGWIALTGDGTATRGIAARHLCRCADCRNVVAGLAEVDVSLRRTASRGRIEPPADLAARIVGAVRAETRRGGTSVGSASDAAPGRSRLPYPRIVMPIALAAVAALALMLWPSRPARPPATAPDTTVVTTNAHRPTGAAAAGVSGTAPLTTLVAPVGTLLRQDPLQTEADHVYADARSAVQFLALNFLPTPPDTVTGRESRGTSGS